MTRRLSILALILVLATAGLGVAYGAWSQNLTINGTVHTGTMEAHFASFVAPTDHYVSTTGSGIGPAGTVTIKLDNLYPGYQGTFSFQVVNGGTIPIEVPAMTFSSPQPSWLTIAWSGCPAAQLAPLASETCSVTISVPQSEAGNMNQTATLDNVLTVQQFSGH